MTSPNPISYTENDQWDAQMKAAILKVLNDRAISEWTRKILDVLIPHLSELYKKDDAFLTHFTTFLETKTEDALQQLIAVCPKGEINGVFVKKQLEQIKLKKVLPDVDPWSYCDKKHSSQ